MKLYNQHTKKIQNIRVHRDANGSHYVDKLSDEQLNELGLYPLLFNSLPNRRYYTYQTSSQIIGTKYVIGYTSTDKQVTEVQEAMIKDLEEVAEGKETTATVDTGLGFNVRASRNDLDSFERGAKRGILVARDTNGEKHSVTVPQLAKIAEDIETNGLTLFGTKWTKFDEIKALQTVADCILYEATPYDYIITQEDVDADIEGNLTVGQTIVRHRNRVKDW